MRAEEDRAMLVATDAATLVELFLLRRLTQLQPISETVANRLRSEYSLDSITDTIGQTAETKASFDGIWLVDSSGHIQRTISNHEGRTASLNVAQIEQIARLHHNARAILIDARSRQHTMFFIEPVHTPAGSVILAAASSDSLRLLLENRRRPGSYSITVTALTDTLVSAVPVSPNKPLARVERPILTPAGTQWVVSTAYEPSSRGVRIALWVVGLGAIIGLGIGLVLERREASRIADRSSELEHLSAELLRANRAKSEFLANVSHELRTPLNAIVGFVDLLRDGVYGPLNSRQAGPVERIEASATHLRHLVDQVLDLAKMAAGRLEVHAEPIELRPFVFDVASEVEPLMSEKGLSFSLAVGASLPRVRTDPTHLRQILINLLGNAVKFTANGGISVRGKLIEREDHPAADGNERMITLDILPGPARPKAAWIALQVTDSGIGIPEKDRERIFDEFEQVNAGPRGDSMRRGTGLGLSISRRLARLLGGDITVESELGRGSVFTVWLPVDPSDLRADHAA
jgi:signal transduction histidine kinase